MTLARSQDGLSLVSREVQFGGLFQHRGLENKPWSIHSGVATEQSDVEHVIIWKGTYNILPSEECVEQDPIFIKAVFLLSQVLLENRSKRSCLDA